VGGGKGAIRVDQSSHCQQRVSSKRPRASSPSSPHPHPHQLQTRPPNSSHKGERAKMNDFDPLHPAHYQPQPQQQQHRSPLPDSSLSSVAPRSPLPGYDRDYRPPHSDSNAQQQRPGAGDENGSAATWGEGQQQQHRQQGAGGMVARAPQATEGPNGPRRTDHHQQQQGVSYIVSAFFTSRGEEWAM
jgi:hypothetical protein